MDYYCMIDKAKINCLNTSRKAWNFHIAWWGVPVICYLCTFFVCLFGFTAGIFSLFYLIGYALAIMVMAGLISYERKHPIYKK